MSDYLDPANEELLKDFFAEAQSQVDLLEQSILILENDTGNKDAIDEIFRAAHTLKGSSATVQMDELSGFTHLVEDVLDAIRSGKVMVGAEIVDTLLAGLDIIKAMLDERAEGAVYTGDISETKAALESILRGQAAPAGSPKTSSPPPSAVQPAAAPSPPLRDESAAAADTISEYDLLELREAAGDHGPVFRVRVTFDEANPMNSVGGIQVYALLKGFARVLRTDPDFDELYEDRFFPTVDYYVASREDEETVAAKTVLTDVTLAVDVKKLTGAQAAAGSAAKKATPSDSATQPKREESDGLFWDEQATEGRQAPTLKETPGETPAAESMDTAVVTPDARPEAKKAVSGDGRRTSVTGSILRVESRRIDDLLNLVSETVINKATFSQVSAEFTRLLGDLQTTEEEYRAQLKELFDALPDFLDRIQQGVNVKQVKREVLERFGDMVGLFDPFQSKLKATVAKFRNTAQNLGRITGELQEGVMRIRMVPISQIFNRFPRLVRDLSRDLKKHIRLEIEGEDTELDKSVIEDLLDPLIHCVRNSIDHGIESPADRAEAGKPEEGRVFLRASNEGNMILIEISDDGKGIDVDAVRTKAVERGIVHPSKNLTEVEAQNLIFDPGFSTAKAITNISGRGVGLDVVKKQIEKLNGNVAVSSSPGEGTTFTIKIPLTLAIIQGLLVRVGEEMYAIPITSVFESHRIRPSEIKMIDNYEVFNVRDDVVSLLRLNRLFRIPTDEHKEHLFVVIVGSGNEKMGIIVDSLIGEEDVVIKPLRDHYTNVPGIAGANITGDGTVSLIIDVSQLLQLGLRREMEERHRRETRIT